MKKKCLTILAGLLVMCSVAACGGDNNQDVVDKFGNSENNGGQSADNQDDYEVTELRGYVFEANGVSMTTDMDVAPIVKELGEANEYFESASCAFDGVHKTYTYDDFRIETYPTTEKDLICYIIFLNDLVETPEGICIGMTKADMEDAYGTDYEESTGKVVYTKEGMHLCFIFDGDSIISIEYSTAVLDNVE